MDEVALLVAPIMARRKACAPAAWNANLAPAPQSADLSTYPRKISLRTTRATANHNHECETQ